MRGRGRGSQWCAGARLAGTQAARMCLALGSPSRAGARSRRVGAVAGRDMLQQMASQFARRSAPDVLRPLARFSLLFL